ncbi:MAG: rRNA maturation RNase YbeY [Blastocatellia bacterium]
MIEVVNRQRLVQVDAQNIKELAVRVIRVAAPPRGISPDVSLSVAFVRDRVIRKLNRDHRGQNRETDVLSFPAGGEYEIEDEPGEGEYLGDVVISTDTAVRQAGLSGLRIEREMEELVLHGVLHLCGYDHETDRGEMNRLELRLRKRLLDRPGSTRRRPPSS